MKRKPILFNKVAKLHQDRGREVIGLIGAHHGAGVTYTGLMLAFYMGEERGKKTALLECNEHHDMALIHNAYEWSREDDLSFSFHLVTCFKEVTSDRIASIFSENYECIIMDFGIDFMQNREEFLRCSTKIVLSGCSCYNLLRLNIFSDMVKTIPGSNSWLYFIPQLECNKAAKIKNEVIRKVFVVPKNTEPVMPSRDTNRFFDLIF